MVKGQTQVDKLYAAALAEQHAGRWREAEAGYRRVLAQAPNLAEAHTGLGNVLQALGRVPEAIDCYRSALAAKPTHVTAQYNLGIALAAIGRRDEAIDAYRAALRLNANLFQAHANLGVLLHDANDLDGAENCYRSALSINPNDVETTNNAAVLLRDRGRLAEAAPLFARALMLKPQSPEIRRNFALLHLLNQDYARGWEAYEWRWKCADFAGAVRPFTAPRWTGEALQGGKLLVWSEQGLGDEILFAGMANDLVARGVNTMWEADPRLVALLQRSFPAIEFLPRGAALPAVAAQIPAGSLGSILRASADAFPKDRSGYLKVDEARRAQFRARLALQGGQRAVGISWRSRNQVFGHHKSSTLREWANLLARPDAVFVDLQYGDTADERGAMGRTLVHLDDLDLTTDIDGVAALIAACDEVVTVSNTTAHLAGALGIPTSVLVPYAGGKLWYWGHQISTPTWYPTVRLFRQERAGDWTGLLDTVANAWHAGSTPA